MLMSPQHSDAAHVALPAFVARQERGAVEAATEVQPSTDEAVRLGPPFISIAPARGVPERVDVLHVAGVTTNETTA